MPVGSGKGAAALDPGEQRAVSGSGARVSEVQVSEAQGVQVGDGGTQVNHYHYGGERSGQREAAEAGTLVVGAGTLVVGDVPQEPPACARRRVAEGWRLVAWVDASDEASVLAGLAQVALAAGVGPAGEDARVLAAKVRHWLEADGARRLLVLDNAVDLDALRPFLPAGGAAQVIITSTRRSAAGLGRPVPVDVFTEAEAVAFLAARTGLDDVAGARELAGELGCLPLGLAQAAALIASEHLSYGTYLGRLRAAV